MIEGFTILNTVSIILFYLQKIRFALSVLTVFSVLLTALIFVINRDIPESKILWDFPANPGVQQSCGIALING